MLLEKNSLDFSFSGLKTAVKREVDTRILENHGSSLSNEDIEEISYEVEETISEILSIKLLRALELTDAKMLCLAG